MDAPAETFSFTVLVASQADLYDSPFDFFKKKLGYGSFCPDAAAAKASQNKHLWQFPKENCPQIHLNKSPAGSGKSRWIYWDS